MIRSELIEEIEGRRCHECGNQAKKDCLFMRCRTCCRAQGFQCQTHIHSTWLPAYRRHQHEPKSSTYRIPSTSAMTNFPTEVSSLALLRRVQFSTNDGTTEQYAYQTAVNIGGHVFKGILYDIGVNQTNYRSGEAKETLITTASVSHPNLFDAFASRTQFFPSV